MKIAFSLLHYKNKKVTEEAIHFLQQLEGIDACEIIIVDNASPNGSGLELKEQYKEINNIHVLLNDKNGGFAYGNNVGYAFARKSGCDIIVVMNNDIFIKDTEFIAKLKNEASRTEGEVIAPHIIGRNGLQNPFRIKPLSDEKLLKMYRYNSSINLLYHIPGIRNVVASVLDRKSARKTTSVQKSEDGIKCVPHGACVIFLPGWVKEEKFAFVPKTFMYFEEDILAEYMRKKGYSAVYKEKLVVFHVEDASVDYDKKTSVKKRLFISACMKDSIKTLISMRTEVN